MAWPKLLVLVRHGESVGNTMTVQQRAAYPLSSHAYPLTERGRQQATITGDWLRETFGTFDVRFTSYYMRTVETMKLLCPDEPYFEDARLAESQRGIYHVVTHKQMKERFPEELERKKLEGLYHYRPLGGENWPDLELRIHSFEDFLIREHSEDTVLCSIHGNWRIAHRRVRHHVPIEELMDAYNRPPIENASVTVYRGTGHGRSKLELIADNFVPWEGILPPTQHIRNA